MYIYVLYGITFLIFYLVLVYFTIIYGKYFILDCIYGIIQNLKLMHDVKLTYNILILLNLFIKYIINHF